MARPDNEPDPNEHSDERPEPDEMADADIANGEGDPTADEPGG